jgi:hypothetical protein
LLLDGITDKLSLNIRSPEVQSLTGIQKWIFGLPCGNKVTAGKQDEGGGGGVRNRNKNLHEKEKFS